MVRGLMAVAVGVDPPHRRSAPAGWQVGQSLLQRCRRRVDVRRLLQHRALTLRLHLSLPRHRAPLSQQAVARHQAAPVLDALWRLVRFDSLTALNLATARSRVDLTGLRLALA